MDMDPREPVEREDGQDDDATARDGRGLFRAHVLRVVIVTDRLGHVVKIRLATEDDV